MTSGMFDRNGGYFGITLYNRDGGQLFNIQSKYHSRVGCVVDRTFFINKIFKQTRNIFKLKF